MWMLVAAFLVAFAVTLAIVRSAQRLEHLAGDHDLSGPQKFHARPVPRIGGVGIFVGVLAGAGLAMGLGQLPVGLGIGLLVAALPAFASGVAEDLTKSQSPRRRMFFTAVSAVLAVWLVQAVITRTDIPGLDWVVGFAAGAAVVTVFVVTGVANAVNIIDGFNGLASMCVAL
ncbi:MAG: glycosyltransferase, partial [Aquincola sp.]|nr:glycosyltransferase [Aquincola sp.]